MTNEQPPVEDPSLADEDPWGMFQDVVHHMTIDEIKDRYKDIGILSQNRNATVRLSIHNKTGERVVMKILNKSSYTEAKKRLLLYREIRTLQALGNQKHITELYEVIDSGDRIWVVMEYAAGGELFDFVKAKAPLVESAAREIFRPIVRVVAYMHSIQLVHRDLKLENVLLDTSGRILLADFGFSRRYDSESGLVDSICGTPHYSPPEIIQGLPHNPIYVDSWSLGIILFMLFFGKFPFNGLSIPELLQSIIKAELVLPFALSTQANDLLNHLIAADPKDRLSAAEIMHHAWFNKNRIPHPPKPDNKAAIHAAVLHDLGMKDLSIDQVDTLDDDDLISYKITYRRYQIGAVPIPPQNLPKLVVPNNLDYDQYRPAIQSFHTRRTKAVVETRKENTPFGMNSAKARERFPTCEPFLQVLKMEAKVRTKKSKSQNRPLYRLVGDPSLAKNVPIKIPRPNATSVAAAADSTGKYKIRKLQTMRLRSMDSEELPLPQMNCQHTTLDKPDVVWKKLLSFLEREKDISIITEQDFGMYLLISEPHELYVALNLGCVHTGFGLIGYSLYNIRGDENEFHEFENKLVEYFGF
ncbi:CAMK family protein kinase [Tritrichomonas foetus]|uniref:CAMK family protein kinase n=1 Tax=Tritrichomonas foetus TaxID=1144522 RepID=A0A1J4JGE3_9EUKA|nr:CAMK family protein kinase [Tritrichomonas foetus]|eukprot:OHS96525.1 CAMK family protein kinase [Tritrichomonas foetus]